MLQMIVIVDVEGSFPPKDHMLLMQWIDDSESAWEMSPAGRLPLTLQLALRPVLRRIVTPVTIQSVVGWRERERSSTNHLSSRN